MGRCTSCSGSALCPECEHLVTCLRGWAAARGDHWALSVGYRRSDLLIYPWPSTERERAIAITKVSDIAGADRPEIQRRLAEAASRAAAKRWEFFRRDPDELARWLPGFRRELREARSARR